MRALVAGGAGFVGSHLCDRLVVEGLSVVCVDNLISGSRRNVEHLTQHNGFEFWERDVCEPIDVEVDVVFHLASPASPNPASPKSYIAHPIETALANSVGTYQLLELARRRGARFVLASTSEAYGDPLEHPQVESYWGHVNPVGERSCYDESKRFGEALTMAYVRVHGLDGRIVRIFNTYGPRLDPEDGRMLGNFIVQALAGAPITIFGDGTKTRSLCYVSDLVEGLWRAATQPGLRGEVFNLGNPDERTVLDYAHLIRDLCGSASEFVHLPELPDDPARRRPDISKARQVLGWEPEIPLRDGLRETITWYRELPPTPTLPRTRLKGGGSGIPSPSTGEG